jgi:hypothetical protein
MRTFKQKIIFRMSMKNKLSIILISLFINISLKKPMWFFFNQLGMPFELYLI